MSQEKIRKILGNYAERIIRANERGAAVGENVDILNQTLTKINEAVIECLPLMRMRTFDDSFNDNVCIGINSAISIFKSNWEEK